MSGRERAIHPRVTINPLSSSSAAQICSSRLYDPSNQVSKSAGVQDGPPKLSKLGSDMKQLEDLLQTDPSKFKQVTSEIAQKLQDAAQSAADSGHGQEAGALNDMAAKFKTASEAGTMPHLHRGHHDRSPTSSSTIDRNTSLTDVEGLLTQYTQYTAKDPMSTLTGILDGVLGTAK
jgi:hypothetical protein